MNDNYNSVRGYRVLGDPPKPDKQISTEYLKLKPEAAHALTLLRASVKRDGANCVGREDFFSGEELPSDRDAALACSGCPSFESCDFYKKVAHPAWGVYAGEVRGRGLMEELEDDIDV